MSERAFCLPNLSSHAVTSLPFWEKEWPIPSLPSKEAFHKWRLDSSTEHCCFSLTGGFDPYQRVTPDNAPFQMVGFVADYDARFTDDEYEQFVARSLEGDFPVSYIGRSFRKGIHAIWMFEKPILLHGSAPTKRFVSRLARRIECAALARGLDPNLTDVFKYYSVGGPWQKVSETRIPCATLHHLQYEASTTADFVNRRTSVPLPDVAEAVEARFPGRWTGPFVEGARGPRFWDVAANNASAAVVRTDGMQCFTGDIPFVTWAEIFGPKFVAKYVEERVSGIIADYFYDGQMFWHAAPDGSFVRPLCRADMSLTLKVTHEMNSRPPKGESVSEMERALQAVIAQKRVDAAIPFVFNGNRVITRKSGVYLNSSTLRPLAMQQAPCGWGDGFKDLAEWLAPLFGEEQLPYFLGWAARFYKSAADGEPLSGQALFILGDPDSGKTLLNTKILSTIFGGHGRAADFLLSRTQYNGTLFDHGLWALDDEVGEADKTKFSGRLKEFVANYDFMFSEKWRKGASIDWKGRIVATLNCDYESIRLMPDLDMNIVDKLIVLKAAKTPVKFTPERIDRFVRQLPAFCRYLYDYSLPPEIVGGERFGVKSYINEDIRAMALIDNRYTHILEMVDMFVHSYCFTPEEENRWEGTASSFLSMLSNMGSGAHMARITTPQALARGFSHLVSKGHPSIQRGVRNGNVQKWCIRPTPLEKTHTV